MRGLLCLLQALSAACAPYQFSCRSYHLAGKESQAGDKAEPTYEHQSCRWRHSLVWVDWTVESAEECKPRRCGQNKNPSLTVLLISSSWLLSISDAQLSSCSGSFCVANDNGDIITYELFRAHSAPGTGLCVFVRLICT